MLYAEMFGNPTKNRCQRQTVTLHTTPIPPRFPAIEQAPRCACNSSKSEVLPKSGGSQRTYYFPSPALVNHLLSGVFETQHDTTGVDAHEPIEINGRCLTRVSRQFCEWGE